MPDGSNIELIADAFIAAGLDDKQLEAGLADDMVEATETISTPFDEARAEVAAARRGAVTPFDRLAVASFFGAPPRGSMYHTKRAESARQRAQSVLPEEHLTKAQQALEGKVVRSGEYADSADHNVMTLAYSYLYADLEMPVLDGGGFFNDGSPCGHVNAPKKPRGARWQGRGTTDHDQLTEYWRGEGEYPPDPKGAVYPVAGPHLPRNICFIVPKGFMVVDLDGARGDAEFKRLIEENGELPQTWTSISGSGGRHYVFRTNKDIRNTASAMADKIDIRGVGGQIVVEPSLHKSGGFYRWADGLAPWECEVANAPEWLENLAYEATKSRKKVSKTKKGGRGQKPKGQAGLGFEAYMDSIGDHDGGVGFHAPIYSAACSWFSVNGSDADASDLFDILQQRILDAVCDDNRNVDRYATDEYLEERIEDARAFIEEAEAEEKADIPGVADEFEPITDWLPKGYKVRGETIYLKGEENDTPLCQLFNVIGRNANEDASSGAGVIINFTNRNGEDITMTLDRREIMKEGGGEILDTLADADMLIYVRDRKGKGHLLDLFHRVSPKRLITTIKRPGWVRDRSGAINGFLCPTGEFIPVGDASQRLLHANATVKDTQPLGTLGGWQEAASAAPENFYWATGVASGFAGPVMGLLGLRPCGLFITGDSSMGKTSASHYAISAWTSPLPKQGNFFTLNSTPNAVEDLAVYGSETVVGLDELGAMQRPGDLAAMLFGLESGVSKSRKRGYGPEDLEFAPFVILTYERGLREFITAAGGTYNNGLSVRFPTVNASEGKKVSREVFDKVEGVHKHFGHAGPAFVRWLISEGYAANPVPLKERHSKLVQMIVGKNAGQQITRAARVFALVALSGELAKEAGLIDFDVLPHVKEAFKTFRATDEARAFTGGGGAVDEFRSFLASQMGVGIVPVEDATAERNRTVIGWQSSTHYILNWEALADPRKYGMSCTRTELVKALKEIGAVETQGKNNYWTKLPDEIGLGKLNNIRVLREKLEI
ncbi:bifunctional DNA primase/polymerase [Tritonibacter mobilis]|uniref:bifunctional DNA primase/polymerase n=1 Tax=Tritonibacter mobilis TaxID=379347 RepID=UPI003A5C6120